MSASKTPRWNIAITGAGAALIGGFWLVAWWAGYAARWSATGTIVTVKTNTALGLLLAGAALLLSGGDKTTSLKRWAGTALAIAVLFIGSLTLSQHLFHIDLGIDQLMASEAPGAAATLSPNRMGLPASTCFTLLGIGLLAMALGRRRLAPYLGLAICLINLIPAVGFLYGIHEFYTARPTGIAWPTVMAMLLLGSGLVLSHPDVGPMALLLRRDAGGALLRRLLPTTILLPLGLGFFRVLGQHHGLYDTAMGTGLLMLSLILIFSIMLWRNAVQLSRADRQQKQAEEALRESEERFRLMLESAKEYALFMLDLEGRILTWNAGAQRMKGYAAEEIVGQHMARFYTAEDVAAGKPQHELAIAREQGQHVDEGWRVRKDGSRFWANVTITTMRDGAGELRGFTKLTQDRTEQRQMAERVASLAQFPEENPHPVLRVSLDGQVVYANQAAKALVADVEVARSLGAAGAEALRQGAAREFDLRCGDGKVFSFHCVPLPERGYANLYGRDVTDARRAEESLRESEERFRLMGDTIPYGAWMADAEGRNTYISPLFLELVGRTFEQVKEFGWTDKMPPEDVEPIMQRWIECTRTGRDWEGELRFPSPDGRWHTILSRGKPLRDGQGQIKAWIGINLDITERKRAEESLRQNEERFRALTMATSDVLYRMSPDWSEMRQLRGQGFIADTEAPNRNWLAEYIHPDDQAHVKAAIDQAIATRSIFSLEHQVLRVDGTLGWTFSRAVPLLDGKGEIVEWFGAASDVTERKRAMEALRQSEEQLRALADAIPNLAWWANADGYITWYNRRWYEYTGTTPEDMEGWGWQSVHDPQVLPAVLERWKASIATGAPFEMTFPLRGADGRFRAFLTRVQPMKDAQGRVTQWFGTNTDVEDIKQAEEAQSLLAAIVESSDDAILSKDLDGTIQTWNAAAQRILGYRAEEIIGRPIALLLPPERAGEEDQIFARMRRGERLEHFETIRVTKDGRRIDVSVTMSPLMDGDGQVVGASTIVRDITEDKRAAEAIRRSDERYRSLFGSLLEGFCIIEVLFDADKRPNDYRFLEINPAFEGQTGLHNALGKRMRELAPEQEAFWFEVYGKVALTGEPMRFVNEAKVLNRWYDVSAYRIGGPDSRKVAVLFNDITETKRAEQSLKQTADELARSNKDLEQFAYVASHDLQEPLRMVTGYLQLIDRRYKDKLDHDAREFVQFAVDGATRMSRLITELLDYSRISTRGKPPEPVAMEGVLQRAVENLQVAIRDSGAQITHDALPTVRGDATQLVQLLQNLVGNAIKFRSANRPIQVCIAAHMKDDTWVFSVKDNGIGIEPQYADKIFLIFQRLHSRAEYPGTGIGLAICKKIVERHGGRIWLESRLGEGSTFFFTLGSPGTSR